MYKSKVMFIIKTISFLLRIECPSKKSHHVITFLESLKNSQKIFCSNFLNSFLFFWLPFWEILFFTFWNGHFFVVFLRQKTIKALTISYKRSSLSSTRVCRNLGSVVHHLLFQFLPIWEHVKKTSTSIDLNFKLL